MSKRPYYIITHTVDYDGYENYIDYIGTNLKTALKRFHFLREDIKQRYFIREGIDEERICGSLSPEGPEEYLAEYLKQPGNYIRANLNDDCDCWIAINLYNLETNHFTNYNTNGHSWDRPVIMTDNREREEMFKQQFPDSKY